MVSLFWSPCSFAATRGLGCHFIHACESSRQRLILDPPARAFLKPLPPFSPPLSFPRTVSLPASLSRPPPGASGSVVSLYETVGVRFDSQVAGGHSLSGLCEAGHGHICYGACTYAAVRAHLLRCVQTFKAS